MLPSDWQIPHVEPCDATALDAIADLSEAELADLAGPQMTGFASTRTTRTRTGNPDWRHHTPMTGSPAFHYLASP